METETQHTESPGVLGKLGIHGPQLIGQLLNFGIIAVVLWRFVYKPLLKKMDERSKKISDGLAFSEEATKALNQATREKEELLRQAQHEARAILDATHEKAETLRQEKLDQTNAELDRLAKEASARIAEDRKAAYSALQRDIADLVTRAAVKVTSGLDEKAHHHLIDEAIHEVERA